jgi:hypothetical protein
MEASSPIQIKPFIEILFLKFVKSDGNKTNGFFVDLAANHYNEISNSYYLELNFRYRNCIERECFDNVSNPS